MANSDEQSKTHVGIVVVGHSGAGKSTTISQLIYQLGGFDDKHLEELRTIAEEMQKPSSAFAFYMDKHKDERERGMTINCNSREMHTEKFHFTVLDVPGRRSYIKNMIPGTSQSDVAILMVPATEGDFEASIEAGNHQEKKLQGQTRHHARLLHILGVMQVIVCINHMDRTSGTSYSQARYVQCKKAVEDMLKKIGFKTKKIPFIPISGLQGDNLTKRSSNMDWYNGFQVKPSKGERVSGVTLLDALNNAIKPPKREPGKPFRMPVSNVYLEGHKEAILVAGRIEQGTISRNASVQFSLSGEIGKVTSIQMHHKTLTKASHGDQIGVKVVGIEKDKAPVTGDVMIIYEEEEIPPQPVQYFQALIYVQDHPGKLRSSGLDVNGFTPMIHIRTAKVPCQLVKILWKSRKKKQMGKKKRIQDSLNAEMKPRLFLSLKTLCAWKRMILANALADSQPRLQIL